MGQSSFLFSFLSQTHVLSEVIPKTNKSSNNENVPRPNNSLYFSFMVFFISCNIFWFSFI